MDTTNTDATQLFGYNVVTSDGNNIGSVDGVWVDDATNLPEFVAVKTGMIFGKNHLMPIEQAQVDSANQTITVPYSEDQIKNGPSFGTDDTLSPEDEQTIYSYYGMQRSTATSPTGYAGSGTGVTDTTSTVGTGVTDTTAFDTTTTGTTDTTAYDTTTTGTFAGQTDLPTPPTEVDMTTSEEELAVGKRVVQAGQVRLRKVVRTEHQEVPVELRREDVQIERISADEASGLNVPEDAFQEREVDVSVMEEQPVVAKEAHVTGGVRLTKDVETETQTVGGEVRRTDVEVEGDDVTDTTNTTNTTYQS